MTFFEAVNRAGNAAFAPWFTLLAPLPDWLAVCVTALPVTLFALAVFRFTSDQDGIRLAKDRIKAYLLELWLHKDDPGVLLRAQGQVIVQSLAYLGYSLVPLAVMVVPVGLVVVQLEAQYAFRGLAPGETAIVAVTAGAVAPDAVAWLEPGPGLATETPALRVPDRAQVLWRVRADAAGEHVLGVDVAGARVGGRVVAGEGRAMPATYRADDWRILGYPSEPPLPAGAAITAIEVDYPRARGEFLGLSSASWLLLGATLVLGFALRGALGVTF
jgi:hypothetical protein